jgi:hypothetical protein
MRSKFIALVVGCLFISSSLFSQVVFTQGELTMEVTDIVLSPEVGADSTTILENLNRAVSKLKFTYVFNEDVFSIIQVKEGLFGMDTILIVNDLINMQTYLVQSTGYKKDTLIVPDFVPPFDVEIISKRELGEKLFGLTQVEYTCLTENQDTMMIVTTDDLSLPAVSPSSSFNVINMGTLLSIEMNMGVASIKYQATSFKPEVANTKYISTDFSQMQNLNEIAKPFLGDDSEDEPALLVVELEKEYGEHQPQGTNNDVLIQIAKEGYVTEESIEDHLKSKRDVDIPSIIEILDGTYGSKINYFATREPKSIVSDFKRWGLYTPSISTILSDTSYWSSLNKNLKVEVLQFAAMHDAYLTETARQQIVDNAKSIRFITDAPESINEQFINGEIGIDDWYGQFDAHALLKQGKSKGIDEIHEIVQYMFDEVFVDQGIEVTISSVNDKIAIESNNTTHILLLENFYEEDYEGEYNEKESRYEYKEDVEYNVAFYNSIVDKIKQVAADNELPQGYSIYTTQPLGPLGFDHYEYQELIAKFPSLDHYEERYYLKKMIKKVYDPWAKLNMYFPYHPDIGLGVVSTFGPGHMSGVSFDIQYVTTENKLKFVQFLKDNAEVYNLDVENIKKDSLDIMNNLMEGAENLIRFLGPVKLSVSKVFSVTPKSEYRKKFAEKRNGLSTAYYNIASVLGDDLDISQFRYDEEAHKEHFVFDGKEYSIDPGGANMMKFISKQIKKNKSGKKFYRENTFSVSEEVYYYLLPEHVKILRSMVNLPI